MTLQAMTGQLPDLVVEGLVTSGLMAISSARIVEPLRLAATRPGIAAFLHSDHAPVYDPVDGLKRVFIRYRPRGAPSSWPLQRALLNAGYLLVAEVDDLLWDDDAMAGRGLEKSQVYRDSDFIAYRGVHAIQVPTEALAQEIRVFNPTVRVFPPTIDDIPPFVPKPERSPRIIFAALNRESDWRPLIGPLNRVLRRWPKVTVVTVHDAAFHAELRTSRRQLIDFQPYSQYLHTLGECDIALLPLTDTRFNRAKSDLKFVECASRGTAVLASETVYGQSVVDGATGLLFRTPAEFELQLTRLIDHAEMRYALAAAAHRWVSRERRLAEGVDQRLQWYRDLLADKPSLDAGIRARAAWILREDGVPPVT